MSKKIIITSLLIVAAAVGYYYLSPAFKASKAVELLIDRNLEARGGLDNWKNVTAMHTTGQMDVGKGVTLAYVLDQQRPNKMCFEFLFDEKTTIQCTNGQSGWKVVPFRNRNTPEVMTKSELREVSDSADIYGLLYDYEKRGTSIEILGHEMIENSDVIKLKITLLQGAVRWLYLDAETALEVKMESMRQVRGKPRKVETFYQDWRETDDGLLISYRQETKTEGDDEFHFITVESIDVNPKYKSTRFDMPTNNDKSVSGKGI